VLKAQPHYAVAYTSAITKNKKKQKLIKTQQNKKQPRTEKTQKIRNLIWNEKLTKNRLLDYLSKINVKEEGFFGVGDLNTILLDRIGDVDVVNSFCDCFHWCVVCVCVREREKDSGEKWETETLIKSMFPKSLFVFVDL